MEYYWILKEKYRDIKLKYEQNQLDIIKIKSSNENIKEVKTNQELDAEE